MSPSPGRQTPGKRLIIALRCGRLANRLILFANWAAFAEEHGCRLVNFTFHSYSDWFTYTRGDFYCQYPPVQKRSRWDAVSPVGRVLRRLRLPYHAARNAGRLNERFALLGQKVLTLRELTDRRVIRLDNPEFLDRIREARTVFIYGWKFRAPKLIVRHAEKIRAFFRPVEDIARTSRAVVTQLRQQAEIVVGVHIRGGDYRTWRNGRHFYPPGRYAAWIRNMAEQFPGRRTVFLVASDEPHTADEFPGLNVSFSRGSPVVDLYALAECDYILGPPSTYSQWASFYGNKPLLHLYEERTVPRPEDFSVSFLAEIP